MGTKPNFNSSPLSKFLSNSLFVPHFSFSRSPCSRSLLPFPRLVKFQFFAVIIRPRRETAKFYVYGRFEHMTAIFFSKMIYNSLEFNPYEYGPTFRNLNEMERRKSDKVWKSVSSVFKWRFRRCRRRSCWSSRGSPHEKVHWSRWETYFLTRGN